MPGRAAGVGNTNQAALHRPLGTRPQQQKGLWGGDAATLRIHPTSSITLPRHQQGIRPPSWGLCRQPRLHERHDHEAKFMHVVPEQRPEVYILHLTTESAQSLGLSFPSSQQLGKVPTREPGVTGWQLADDQRATWPAPGGNLWTLQGRTRRREWNGLGRVYMGE